jgi:hypothetical protein
MKCREARPKLFRLHTWSVSIKIGMVAMPVGGVSGDTDSVLLFRYVSCFLATNALFDKRQVVRDLNLDTIQDTSYDVVPGHDFNWRDFIAREELTR